MKKLVAMMMVVVMMSTLVSMNVSAFTQTYKVDDKAITGLDKESEMTLTFEELPSSNAADVAEAKIEDENTVPFKDTLLFGNGDFGHDDGAAADSSIGVVWSMVVDNEKNVWFIDGDVSYNGLGSYWYGSLDNDKSYTKVHESTEYKNQYLRKYDPKTGEVTTLKKLNSIKMTYKTPEGKSEKLSMYRGYKLVHDAKTNKIFMSGKFTLNGGKSDYRGTLFQVNPGFKAVVADKSFNKMFGATDFAFVNPDGAFVYSRKEVHALNVMRLKNTSKVYTDVVGACNWNDTLEAVQTEEYLYVLQSNIGGVILNKYSMNDGKWSRVEAIEGKYDGITSANNKFYASKDGNIDIINLDGSVETYVASGAVTLTKGTGRGTASLLQVLDDGSVVYYDGKHGTFRTLAKK